MNTVGKTCYLDKRCLVKGEDWREGFMHGIFHSSVIVLLVSSGALQQTQTAHEKEDNVLLEWQSALSLKSHRFSFFISFFIYSFLFRIISS